MLVQRCALDQHRLILPVSVTKPAFSSNDFHAGVAQNQYRALVDTGAQRSVLSRSVIQDLRLLRVGHMQFSSLHGPKTHSRFLASVGFWARRVFSIGDPIAFDRAEVSLFNLEDPVELVDMADNTNFDLILGFDVLKHLSFNYDGNTRVFELVVQG